MFLMQLINLKLELLHFQFFRFSFLQNNETKKEKCLYYKCSKSLAKNIYKKIHELGDEEEVKEEKVLAMNHIMSSKIFLDDFTEISSYPVNNNWNKNDFLTRVKEFM